MSDFKKLRAWQLAHSLSVEVYGVVRSFPADERFGLRSQVVRCAGSIGANLAEGCGRSTTRELLRFVDIALGSALELESHLLRAQALGFIEAKALGSYLDQVRRLQMMISRMRGALRARVASRSRSRR
ncbi:MAG TPA: four helix bundle protein [Gemmatimonadales bacterium]|nr:four helix bundle protein [Gemmatimonadales bacterium]